MPVETRKVFWVLFSVAVAILVTLGFAFIARWPGKSNPKAPVSIAGTLPTRTIAPEAYANTLAPAPIPGMAETSPEGSPLGSPLGAPSGDNIIIYYGDKPNPATLQGANSATGTTVPGFTSTTPAKNYSPAGSTPPAVSKTATKPAPVAKLAPKAPAKAVAVTEYWIQAASLAARSRAEDMQRDIAAKGLSSVITVKDIDGKTWYRLRIGPYRAKNEAQAWLEKIKAVAGCAEAYLAMQTVVK